MMYQVDHSGFPTSFDNNNCPLGVVEPSPDTKYCIKLSNSTYTYKASVTNSNIFCLASAKGSQNYNVSPDTQPLAGPCPVLSLDASNRTSYPGNGTDWNDLSGRDNNGVLNGGVSYSPDNGGVMSFDGVSGYVEIPDNASLNPAAVTVGIWVKPNILSGHQRLVAKNSTSGYLFNIYNATPEAYIGGQRIAGTPLTVNRWVYLLVTVENARLKFYINGNIVSDSPYTGTIDTSTSTVKIGTDTIGGNYLNGQIGNVRIYNAALNASDILQNFNAAKGRYGL
jgi:hypothetical protein